MDCGELCAVGRVDFCLDVRSGESAGKKCLGLAGSFSHFPVARSGDFYPDVTTAHCVRVANR